MKPSEIFDSSLRKTFDSITTPKEEERLREEFKAKFGVEMKEFGFIYTRGDRDEIADYWLKIRREAIAERDEEIKKSIEEVYKNAKEDHICRFNDGDSDCECYYTAINDILASLTQE